MLLLRRGCKTRAEKTRIVENSTQISSYPPVHSIINPPSKEDKKPPDMKVKLTNPIASPLESEDTSLGIIDIRGPNDINDPQRARIITIITGMKYVLASNHPKLTMLADSNMPIMLIGTMFFTLPDTYPPKIELGIPVSANAIDPNPVFIGLNIHFSSSHGASQVIVPPIKKKAANKIIDSNMRGELNMFLLKLDECEECGNRSNFERFPLLNRQKKIKVTNPKRAYIFNSDLQG
jgi:hypothetical protein